MINGKNFKPWQENVMIVLRVMDLDLALRVAQPLTLQNKVSLLKSGKWKGGTVQLHESDVMKRAILEAFRDTMFDKVTTGKEFLEKIEKRFAKNENTENSTLLANLISMRNKGKGNIREYIMEMSHPASKLKALKLELSEDLLVHLVLISFLAQFNQFKVSYNYQKETWSLNELISHYVQEETRIKQYKVESAHVAATSKDKKNNNKRKKDKEAVNTTPQKKHKEHSDDKCFFCVVVGHKKKQYTNFHAWCAKKGMLLNLVFFLVNLSLVRRRTLLTDSGATTHISVSMQGCLSC